MPPRRGDDPERRNWREVGLYTTIPMMLLAGPALGYWLGLQIENRAGHEPWFTVGGAMFGLAASIRQVIKVLQKGSREP
jgi:F0F1-type ATP synthase assembly protein I